MTALLDYPTGDIELAVELAIGRQFQAGVWDSSRWDDAVWAQSSQALGDWVDITCDVSTVDVTAGASAADSVVTSIDATTGSLTLHGGQYNPWASAWKGVLGPSVPARIRWRRPGAGQWSPVFLGRSNGWPYDRKSATVAVPVVDATGELAGYDLWPQTPPVGAGELTSARMNRILDQSHWPAASRDIAAGGIACVATDLAGKAFDLLRTAADTDLGIVWARRDARIAFRPVAQAGQWLPDALPYRLVDSRPGPNDICVINFDRSDPQILRNDVTISHDPPAGVDPPPAVPVVRITDDASIARYGRRSYSRTDFINSDDAWTSTVAGVILQAGAWPAPHPQSAGLDIRADTRVADLLLSAEIAQTIDAIDSGTTFHCVVIGYNFHLTRRQLSGEIILDDVTAWVAGRWDSAKWDIDRWGV